MFVSPLVIAQGPRAEGCDLVLSLSPSPSFGLFQPWVSLVGPSQGRAEGGSGSSPGTLGGSVVWAHSLWAVRTQRDLGGLSCVLPTQLSWALLRESEDVSFISCS